MEPDNQHISESDSNQEQDNEPKQDEQANKLGTDRLTEEECNKFLKEDLEGKGCKLTQQFLGNPIFHMKNDEEMDLEKETGKSKKSISSSVPKKNTKLTINAKNQKELSKMDKIHKLQREYDQKYYKSLKETDKIPMNSDLLFKNLEKIKQEVNDLKQINRDEELLKMQKENQKIEEDLNKLKNQDNKDLRDKQEECHKLVNELNELFNQRKKEAAEKEKERTTAIEQIRSIQEDQRNHQIEIKKLEEEKKQLQETLGKLQQDVESYQIYKDFIDQVNQKYSNDSSNPNDLYDNLKEKFEQLMKNENDIKESIENSKKEQEEIKKQIKDMKHKNDKQSQSDELRKLEDDIKRYTEENKDLEAEIDNFLKEKQKKDSDTHQIKLSIFNLYEKAMKAEGKQGKIDKGDNYNMDDDENSLCMKLDKINETIQDLIKIHEELENGKKADDKAAEKK